MGEVHFIKKKRKKKENTQFTLSRVNVFLFRLTQRLKHIFTSTSTLEAKEKGFPRVNTQVEQKERKKKDKKRYQNKHLPSPEES